MAYSLDVDITLHVMAVIGIACGVQSYVLA